MNGIAPTWALSPFQILKLPCSFPSWVSTLLSSTSFWKIQLLNPLWGNHKKGLVDTNLYETQNRVSEHVQRCLASCCCQMMILSICNFNRRFFHSSHGKSLESKYPSPLYKINGDTNAPYLKKNQPSMGHFSIVLPLRKPWMWVKQASNCLI